MFEIKRRKAERIAKVQTEADIEYNRKHPLYAYKGKQIRWEREEKEIDIKEKIQNGDIVVKELNRYATEYLCQNLEDVALCKFIGDVAAYKNVFQINEGKFKYQVYIEYDPAQ